METESKRQTEEGVDWWRIGETMQSEEVSQDRRSVSGRLRTTKVFDDRLKRTNTSGKWRVKELTNNVWNIHYTATSLPMEMASCFDQNCHTLTCTFVWVYRMRGRSLRLHVPFLCQTSNVQLVDFSIKQGWICYTQLRQYKHKVHCLPLSM